MTCPLGLWQWSLTVSTSLPHVSQSLGIIPCMSVRQTGGDVTGLPRGTPPSQVVIYDVISSLSSRGWAGMKR